LEQYAGRGDELGPELGEVQGRILGDELGKEIGVELASALREPLGATLWTALDLELGTALGITLGLELGTALGMALGLALGGPLCSALGLELGLALGPALGETLGDALQYKETYSGQHWESHWAHHWAPHYTLHLLNHWVLQGETLCTVAGYSSHNSTIQPSYFSAAEKWSPPPSLSSLTSDVLVGRALGSVLRAALTLGKRAFTGHRWRQTWGWALQMPRRDRRRIAVDDAIRFFAVIYKTADVPVTFTPYDHDVFDDFIIILHSSNR
jgi:hypothetical protein